MFASVEREDAQPQCPYLLGVPPNTCVTGCWEEPRCITDEPLNGWGQPQVNAPNSILIGFRIDLDEMSIINPGALAREYLEYGVPYGHATLGEIEHAWRVMQRMREW